MIEFYDYELEEELREQAEYFEDLENKLMQDMALKCGIKW